MAQSAKADAAARQAELAALEENEAMVGPEPLPAEQRGGITEFDRGALRPGGTSMADHKGPCRVLAVVEVACGVQAAW